MKNKIRKSLDYPIWKNKTMLPEDCRTMAPQTDCNKSMENFDQNINSWYKYWLADDLMERGLVEKSIHLVQNIKLDIMF